MTSILSIRRHSPHSRAARTALLALAGLACSGLLACSGERGSDQATADGPVPVRAATAEALTVPLEIHAVGNVVASATVSVRARVGGELETVHFTEGDELRKGQLLFTLDRRPFEAAVGQAEAQLERDLAQLVKARSDVRRFGELVEDDFVTEEQYDQARATADALEAAVKGDRAALAAARLDLEYASIRSPIDGRAGDLLVDAGNLVKANGDSPLVVIHQVRPIEVSFAVPERYLGPIRGHGKDAAGLEVRCVPGPAEPPLTGRLAFIDNAVDTATGTIRLKATLRQRRRAGCGPASSSTPWLVLGAQEQAVVVPAQAVQTGQDGRFVFVVGADGTVDRRPVTVDRTVDGDTVIADGLAPGDRVVTDGQLRLAPGAAVTVIAAAGDGGSSRDDAHEHLRALHPPAGHDHPVMVLAVLIFGGDGLPAAPGQRPAQRRLPDHPGRRPACPAPAPRPWPRRWRRRSRRSSRPSPGIDSMTLDELAGHHPDHPPVRPRPQHRRRRPGRPGGDRARQPPAAARTCRARPRTRRSTRPTSRSSTSR